MRATIILCDNAQAVAGKLYMLGACWNISGPGPVTCGVATHILLGWDESNRQHKLRIVLYDEDGNEVKLPGPGGEPAGVEVITQFAVGRPVEIAPGSELPVVFAFNLVNLPLQPSARYRFQLFIDEQTKDDWRADFQMRPPAPPTVVYPPS